jgi:hypothetical protein
MNSSIRFWSITLVLLVVTAGLKVPVGSSDLGVIKREAAARISGFVKSHGATDLAPLDLVALPGWWTGWSFRLNGCPTRAMPSPEGGEMDATLRDVAGADQQVAFVYHGALRPTPPGAAQAGDYIKARLLRSFNLGSQADSFYVVLIYPKACPAVTKLPWSTF